MRYHTILNGAERLVEVVPHGSHFRVHIWSDAEGKSAPHTLDIDAVHLHGHAVSLLSGSRSYACDLEPGNDGKLGVRVNETVVPLEILDERKLRLRKASGTFSLEGPQRIDAPMPGKVVRVLVKKGDTVAEGQGLIVVEAMKMENELKSPKAGVVSELLAVEGAAVENGAKLAVVT
ncbi:MAG: biotin/lipoyl-binding protein [Deltaproteobacteria bacterium]|nr:biotin/lipoyl-binding protein [Deltaproteobacteria bacterium]